LSLTWNKKYRDSFEDWTIPVTHVPYNDLDAIARAIDGQTAAVVLEAIQGEGGVNPADEAYLQGVRALCSQHGTLLVFDEVQAGLGRTGRWFAFEHANIVPEHHQLGQGDCGGCTDGRGGVERGTRHVAQCQSW
jgi:acetylornithine/succinyldiaminopimelate/putrescine aminotransferase